MIDAFAARNLLDDAGNFILAVVGREHGDVLTDGLGSGVAKYSLRACIPGLDDAI